MQVKVKLLASLKDLAGGRREVLVEARTWREALSRLVEENPRLEEAINRDGTPKPGILVFIDGVDSRIAEEGEAREIVILPVNHGGVEIQIVTWADVEDAIDDIAAKIKASGLKPDAIIGIMRGGIIPARLLADSLDVQEILTMEIKLYQSIGVKSAQPYIKYPIIRELRGLRVLIVDDISDSGLSLQLAVEAVSLYYPASISTATLYVKPWTRMHPDYYSKTTDKWIIFPWERHEYAREVERTGGSL
ncbi:MAG: hypothetical protein F7C08_03835 [Desulfurococcales archaeon]|nr:hypothetical protein [Desulfurococcales archaeon]MCE4605644.1 hypothetical protein [Desulfurococcales archaeon]